MFVLSGRSILRHSAGVALGLAGAGCGGLSNGATGSMATDRDSAISDARIPDSPAAPAAEAAATPSLDATLDDVATSPDASWTSNEATSPAPDSFTVDAPSGDEGADAAYATALDAAPDVTETGSVDGTGDPSDVAPIDAGDDPCEAGYGSLFLTAADGSSLGLSILGLATDSRYLYWLSEGYDWDSPPFSALSIFRTPIAACGTGFPELLVHVSSPYDLGGGAIATDGVNVYWKQSEFPLDGAEETAILACPVSGCGTATAQTVVETTGYISGIAVDESYVYFDDSGDAPGLEPGFFSRIPKDGGAVDRVLAGPPPPYGYGPYAWGTFAFATDGTTLYWVDVPSNASPFDYFSSCPVGGCVGQADWYRVPSSWVYSIAVDERFVYIPGGACPKPLGFSHPELSQANCWTSPVPPTAPAIAADAWALYWTDSIGSTIYRASKSLIVAPATP